MSKEKDTGDEAPQRGGESRPTAADYLEKPLGANPPERIEYCETIHTLKTLPEYFTRILKGEKNFEVRRNDRGFQKGDGVLLREYNPKKTTSESDGYTGRVISAVIGFVLSEYQKEGYVAFSLLNIKRESTD